MNTVGESAAVIPSPPVPTMSPFARAVAVFTRPARAWDGLAEHAQWWFPLLILVLTTVISSVVLYDRAMMPMMVDRWDDQVQSGAMTAEQADRAATMMRTPVAIGATAASQGVFIAVWILVVGLVIWFGAGFVLGSKMKYRHALEVSAWAGLINLPGQFLAFGLAWYRETFKGLHVGFGALLPVADPPSKLMTGLGIFLDGLGPFSVWFLIVGILGASALSGAPRRSVAWVLASLYIVLVAFAAILTALFAPAS
jgi:Yip1 domain